MQNRPCRKFLLLVPLIILAVLAMFSLGVLALWNGVLAAVLPVKSISYGQALGLLVLARLLFGGFPTPRGGPFGPPWGRRMMMERWQSLTPEQREELRRRFGDWPQPPWCAPGQPELKRPQDPQERKTTRENL